MIPQLSHGTLNAGQSALLIDFPCGCVVLPHPLHGWIEQGLLPVPCAPGRGTERRWLLLLDDNTFVVEGLAATETFKRLVANAVVSRLTNLSNLA